MNIFRGHDFYFVSRIKINILSICPMTATVLIKQKQQNNYACFSKLMNKTICNWFFFFLLYNISILLTFIFMNNIDIDKHIFV